MPPGLISRRRSRNCRPCTATFSLERSVVRSTVSVTSLAAAVLSFWPLPSATTLSAGHCPAYAAVAARDNAPAMATPNAERRQIDWSCLLLILMTSISFRLRWPQPEWPRIRQLVEEGTAGLQRPGIAYFSIRKELLKSSVHTRRPAHRRCAWNFVRWLDTRTRGRGEGSACARAGGRIGVNSDTTKRKIAGKT